jgi:hypothetical protein
MFAVYATHAAPADPLSALKIGERPEPDVPAAWVRVKVSHASLNRHDLFTLRGLSGQPEGITYPTILGNDAAGTLDDGTPVVLYPMMGSEDWRGDETLDPGGTSPASSSKARSPTMPWCRGATRFRCPRTCPPFTPRCWAQPG